MSFAFDSIRLCNGRVFGAGAGSVFIQGRSDLDLLSGTEFRIRASAPR
jgi:hypothetical protein